MGKKLLFVGAALFLVAMLLFNKPVPMYPIASPPILTSEAATMVVLVPLVAKWEGRVNAAYLDLVGVPTICSGHTRTITKADVEAGVTWTDAKCDELLRVELVEYRRELHEFFTTETKDTRLPPKRDAAYSSLAFNVGWTGAGNSTATKRLNAGNIAGGCDALTWWNRAGKRVVRGLVRRRADEYALCMDGLDA